MVGATPTICDFRDQTADSSTTSGFWLGASNNGKLRMYSGGAFLNDPPVSLYAGQWSHFAVVRSSGTIKIFVNGIQTGSDVSNSTDFNNSNYRKMRIGAGYTGSDLWNGKISNFRITKGQALYTTAFKPSTEPLTTTSQGATASNVKLLCCNNSSTTGSTVTPVTPANNGSPTASTDSPFDDPANFVFGENEDQNIVKCGSYTGDVNQYPEINLGWEPQWVMIKRASGTGNWYMWDTMRGFITGGNSPYVRANGTNAENNNYDAVQITPTGFSLHASGDWVNSNSSSYIYCAIRRPDGYVGKPPELGTDVFGMDLGTASGSPKFISNFPVDFATIKLTNGADNWYTSARLMQGKGLYTNTSAAEYADSTAKFDFNNGYYTGTLSNSAYMGWMWKRHAGFTISTYKGDAVSGRQITHDMNKTPEFMIVKSRGYADGWIVYHKGMNGGTNPQNYYMQLQTTAAEAAGTGAWNDTAPTSSHFTVGNWAELNRDGYNFIALLFASVDGISKVGSYTGNGSATSRTITLGFQPRFLILKNANGYNDWFVFDTVRGWASGNDTVLSINSDAVQYSGEDYGAPTSTGFTITSSLANVNENNSTYIYYAHA